MEARRIFSNQFSTETSHYEYILELLQFFEIMKNKLDLNARHSDLTIFGGIIFFVLFYEAQLEGLIDENEIDSTEFLRWKPIDLDIHGILLDEIEDEKHLMEIGEKVSESFNRFVDYQNVTRFEKMLGPINSSTKITFFEYDIPEIRPQLFASIGPHRHHLLEILLQTDNDPLKSCQFVTSHFPTFLGENILVSIRDQLYPIERAWREIEWESKTRQGIFRQVKTILDSDEMAMLKFRQGGFRSEMVRHILKKAIETNHEKLLKIIVPKNKILSDLIFYFSSSRMRLLVPDLSKEGTKLYMEWKTWPREELASPTNCLKFVDLALKAWKTFEEEIL